MFDRTFTRGLIGLSALTLLAACQSPYASTTHEPGIQPPTPNFPVRQEAAANPPAPAPVQAPPAVRAQALPPEERPVTLLEPGDPEPPIVTHALPPPAPFNPPSPQPAPAPVVAAAPPSPPPPAAPAMETRMVTAGPVVNADGPSTESHTVKSGETLYSISRSMGMTVKQAADINGLKEPYTLKVGQRIKGKPSRGKAYVVQSGDTLSAIGRRFSVSATQLANANDAEVGDAIRPGQKLLLPAGFKDLGAQQIQVAVAASTPSPTYERVAAAPTPPARPIPAANTSPAPPPVRPAMPAPNAVNPPPAPRPSTPAIIPTAPAATPTDIASAGRGAFIWPVSGRQLTGFGSRGANQVSNGLNISAPAGASVKAAGPGQVIYAGSEVQGFGNLVLVQHADGFVTVYAHLQRIAVTMREQVRQGQEIGQVGMTGGVNEPQLYFEMRHQPSARDQHKPFDPTLVLPER